jgi:hypothetical protein
VFQQLPGKNVRIFKVVDDPAAPSVFNFEFKNVPAGWRLAKGTYGGSAGVILYRADGTRAGFLSAPSSRDANQRPLVTDWRLDGNAIQVEVDYSPAVFPVVVDPQWLVDAWLTETAVTEAAHCIGSGIISWQDTVGEPWYARLWRAALTCMSNL